MSRTGQVSSRFGQPGLEVPAHRHRDARLVVGLGGSATIGTADRDWTIAPRSLLWLEGGTSHRLRTTGDHRSLVVSFPPDLVRRPNGFLDASGFIHDLVDRLGRAPDAERRDRLTAVLVDELLEPVPESARLARVAAIVSERPAASVPAIAREIGLSERSLRRWFRAEVGTTFTRWHQQRLVEQAIARLDRGESVKAVAADLGYTASAFIAMFKRVTSRSPRRYR